MSVLPQEYKPTDRGGVVELTLPKDAAWVGVARLAAAGIAHRAGLSLDAIDDVKIMVAEGCTYCIQRGHSGGMLHIFFEASPLALAIAINDPAFPRLESESAIRLSPDVCSPSDGLFIIRSLADSLDFTISADHGLTLRMTKNIE